MRVLLPVLGLFVLLACGGQGNPNQPSPASQLTVTAVHLWEHPKSRGDCIVVPTPSHCVELQPSGDGTYPFRSGDLFYTFHVEYTTACGKTIEVSTTNDANITWGLSGGPSFVACAVGGGPKYFSQVGFFAPSEVERWSMYTNDHRVIVPSPGFLFTVNFTVRELASGQAPVEWTRLFPMKYIG